ncbi:MAG: zinc ribbon domain-containing protein [Chloroflexi bacterium]|nr:zinc ribbon domain-containing protein [Chloroflexota bacterium]
MPTYVYKCADHGHVFELIQKFTDESGANCPTCGSESTRQILAPTVIYKGSGFYTTDYGSGSSSASKPTTGANGSSSDSSSSTSSSSADSGSSSSTNSEPKSKNSGDDSSNSHNGTSHSHGAGSHTH